MKNNTDILYAKSDKVIAVNIVNDSGIVQPITDYTGAEYCIFDSDGNTKVSYSLGNGIAKNGNDFLVTLVDTDMNFTGDFKHQFVPIDSLGNRLEPVFSDFVKVVAVC